MSFLDDLEISESPINGPQFIIVYGGAGDGKSYLCSYADKPFFIPLEKGVEKLPLGTGRPIDKNGKIIMPQTVNDFFALFKWAVQHKNDYKTIVIDSGMFLDKLAIVDEVIAKSAQRVNRDDGTHYYRTLKKDGTEKIIASLSDFDYGEGHEKLVNFYFTRFFNAIDYAHKHEKDVILIAHSRDRKARDKSGDEYNKYCIDMAKFGVYSVPNVLSARADAVLFVQSNSNTKKKLGGFDGKKIVNIADQEDELKITVHTRKTLAFDAKVRTANIDNVKCEYEIDIYNPETSKQLFRDLKL